MLPKSPRTGQEMKSKNPCKLISDGMFGNLWRDQEKLNDFKLEAYKDDKKVLPRKADWDLINLLRKRYNAKKEPSQQSLKTTKLVDLSGLPMNTRSLKNSAGCDLLAAKKTGGSWTGSNIQYYKSPHELVERLNLLIGSKQGGKASVSIGDEIVTVLNRLYQDGMIKKKYYQKLYTAYV